MIIEVQTNAIRTNYVKMQQNSECRLCDDRDENIISEYRNLVQKEYKTRHNWVDWELCKKCKFDQTIKWYIHDPVSVF